MENIPPFYSPDLSYSDNCIHGPFGSFTDGKVLKEQGDPLHFFLGNRVYLPFGIPAGPVPNASFCQGAFDKGFDIVMYKTVRTASHPCNPFPNIVPVKNDGKITFDQAQEGLEVGEDFTDPIAITNSFGVPSLSPQEWVPDMKKAVQMAKKGQVLVGTFQGTHRGGCEQEFIDDWVYGAELMKECGVRVVEMNLSCPNEGTASLLCYDTDRVVKIATAVKKVLQDTPVLLKISYFQSDEHLEDFITRLAPIVDGFDTINTIAGKVSKSDGSQALPGEGRHISGVCGVPIKWAGIEMVKRIDRIRKKGNYDFVIVGTGGVTNAQDFIEYRKAGADAVMSATGAMWNADLAKEIKEAVL